MRQLLGSTVVLCAVALCSASPAFAAVSGAAINQTTGQRQGGVTINLVQPGAGGMQSLGNATTDANGVFSIDATPAGGGPALIQATFQGITYTQPIPPGTPTAGIQVAVYNATTTPPPNLSVEHLILLEPGANTLQVSETFFIRNQSNLAFQDPKGGTLRFYLPLEVKDPPSVTINSVGVPITRPAQPAGQPGLFKVDYAAKPGETRFDVGYTLPASTTFSGKLVATTPPARLVVPGSVTLSGDGVREIGQEPTTQARIYSVASASYSVTIDGIGAIRTDATNGEDAGQPKIEEGLPRVYSLMVHTPFGEIPSRLIVLGLGLAILAAGGVLLYRRGTA